MPQPLSLLAELRALEARRAQSGLSPSEEERLAELRAIAGQPPASAPGPLGFDVNAAAAALREEIEPAAPPPAEAPEQAWPEAAAPDAVPADPGAPQEQAEGSAWDPAVEAAWADYAQAQGWDPAAPWDADTAARHWEGFLRAMGWAAAEEPPAAAPPEPAGVPAPEPGPGSAETARWSLGAVAAPAFEPSSAPPGRPLAESDTAAWDLGSGPGEAEPPAAAADRFAEIDPGTTARWSLAQVGGSRSPPPEAFAAGPEPVSLEDLALESEGSFGGPAGPPPPPLDLGAPPEPEPVEVADDQILEVGDDVTEVQEAPAAEEELPVVEAVELTEEPATPEAAPADAFAALAAAPPEPAPAAADAAAAPGGDAVPLESLTIEEAPPVEEAPGHLLPGLHRVVLHTVEGQVMRGALQDPDLLSDAVLLAAQPAGPAEQVPASRLRAIFFMLAPGEAPPAPAGLRVRVTFRDGRQVAGFSPDYAPEASGFFMVPADSRTNTARIWVYRGAVRQVTVS